MARWKSPFSEVVLAVFAVVPCKMINFMFRRTSFVFEFSAASLQGSGVSVLKRWKWNIEIFADLLLPRSLYSNSSLCVAECVERNTLGCVFL